MTTQASAPLSSKNHYLALDGLRGVAAVLVVSFHICETYALGNPFKQLINHGYLAVDFFFLLSGFVVAYAYDDRWGKMTDGEFYKRRLIRLQPMVVMGSLIGAALFYAQAGPAFPPIHSTPVFKLLLVMLIGCTLIPILPSMDIRGWEEMHPLDGPAWSLFFEYIANILYAVVLRRLSRRILAVLVVLAAGYLAQLAIFGQRGDVIGGWSVTPHQLHIGFARMLYPFLAGVLLMRSGRRLHVKHAFLLSSLMLIVIFSLPRFGDPQHTWMNGLYDAFSIIVLFPLVVAIGAGERQSGDLSTRAAQFLGGISYPLYITHYPLIYVYTSWVVRDHVPAARGAVWGVLLLVTAIAIAYACLKLYDEPVRRWLSDRFLAKRGDQGVASVPTAVAGL